MPAAIASFGMSSTASRHSANHSRASGLQGASAKPQLPITTVVTPCQQEQLPSGSQATCASMCVWPSMKPGATTMPSASIVRSAGARMRPISATRPSLTPTSPRKRGIPEPSTIVPLRIRRSKVIGRPSRLRVAMGEHRGGGGRGATAARRLTGGAARPGVPRGVTSGRRRGIIGSDGPGDRAMADATYDTLAAARKLEAAGIERRHAEAIAETVRDGRARAATKAHLEPLATRADLHRALWMQLNVILAASIGFALFALLALNLFARLSQ